MNQPTKPSIFIGTSGFQYPEWKGTFYPEKLPVSKMLPFYAERFSTTEINYSFRRIPSPKTIAGWVGTTPDIFRFSLKAPQKVTHFAKLQNCQETISYFHEVTLGLGAHRGPILFQLSPSFHKDAPLLLSFLKALPEDMRATFEFRHDSWFDEEIFTHLRDHGAALCLAESADLATPQVSTAEFGYLRLRREDYTKADIARWAKFLSAQSQWKEVFVYFKHEDSGIGPQFAQQMMAALGLVIARPASAETRE